MNVYPLSLFCSVALLNFLPVFESKHYFVIYKRMAAKESADLLRLLAQPKTRAKAFSEVVLLYQERLYWHIRKMVLSHDDAHDVLQNTFMKAWRGLDNFRGDAQLSTWLYKIATNETMTFLSALRMRNFTGIDDVEGLLADQLKADSYFW